MKKMYKICATCAFGLESVLKREIINLGYDVTLSQNGMIAVTGQIEDAFKLNLYLRCANRVLIEVGEFKSESFDELFDNVYNLNWKEYLPKNAKFDIEKITSVHSKLFSKKDSQKIIKKAIVEKLKKQYKTDKIAEDGANYPIFVQIKNDVVSIYLNTSGDGLNKRGYRLNKGKAPLNETLAAGIILLSGYRGECEFADFMCGSGTIAIEAAMIGANIPPGLNRKFQMEEWDITNNKICDIIKKEAIGNITHPIGRILASDIDFMQIKNAKENAARAGVGEYIAFQKMDFRDFKSKKSNGLIVCNPPYGERIGDKKEMENLYADMRKVFDSLCGWSMHVICANPEFQRNYGRKADKNRKLYNGNMLSYLYSYKNTIKKEGNDNDTHT